jgi:hypothetical protein
MSQSVPTSPPPAGPAHDWTVEAVDRLESVVEVVRDKTTVPITKVARTVVYGLVVGVLAIVALILLVIGLFRLHVYLPFDEEGQKVYFTYLVLGAIFVIVGMFLWRRRVPRKKE